MSIRNYAIIDSLEVDWPDGFIAITGETGAGKSIMIGALQFVLGARADAKVLRNPNEKCIVEVSFSNLSNIQNKLENILEESLDDQLILRREILPNGKSRTFINDTPARVQQINEITPWVINIHQQFDQLDILEEYKQFELLDAFSLNSVAVSQYQKLYRQWLQLRKKLSELEEEQAIFLKEQDFINFQYQELDAADLSETEFKTLEEDLNRASKSEEIIQNSGNIIQLIEHDKGISEQILECIGLLKNIRLDPDLHEMYERFQGLREEFKDLAQSMARIQERMEYNPEKLLQMQGRLDMLNRLMKKYRVNEISPLIDIKNDLEGKLGNMNQMETEISGLRANIQHVVKDLKTQAEEISNIRNKNKNALEEEITKLLQRLGMEFAQIEISISSRPEPGEFGLDQMDILFTANKGSKPKSLKNQASGGEISRLNLAIKSVIARYTKLPTMIFDEIDSGVSGQIALQMGTLLKEMALKHQVITITHSAQIASRADHHFFVYKDTQSDQSQSRLRALSSNERMTEIAKMLSGDPPTASAIKNAKELIALN